VLSARPACVPPVLCEKSTQLNLAAEGLKPVADYAARKTCRSLEKTILWLRRLLHRKAVRKVNHPTSTASRLGNSYARHSRLRRPRRQSISFPAYAISTSNQLNHLAGKKCSRPSLPTSPQPKPPIQRLFSMVQGRRKIHARRHNNRPSLKHLSVASSRMERRHRNQEQHHA